MCKQHNPRKIDKCMVNLINYINRNSNIRILATCCGHDRYKMSIIVKEIPYLERALEICSNKTIHRKKRFYKKDKQGYYYIPEVENGKKYKY